MPATPSSEPGAPEPALLERARAWATGDPDPITQAELNALIDARAYPELRERMMGDLEFGTAGLRGVVGAGSARMNLSVVLRVTRALADQLVSHVPDARALPVIVGCDARLDGQRFADAAASVLIAAGIPVKRFARPVPTPLLAYAVRAFGAQAGVMITASHNPPEYNGYKLYWQNGVQVVPPTDVDIAARMSKMGPAREIPRGDLQRQDCIESAIVDRYFAELRSQLPRVAVDRSFAIVYTPLHGVGASFVERLFSEAGYANFRTVPAQREPDGHFPTVSFPNPEEPGALDLAVSLATETRAELIIANDPDVDRLAIAVPTPSGRWRTLTGNQIGLLLADFALRHAASGAPTLVLSSLVSSPMLESIARAYSARAERVLTGFKWIWTAALALEECGLSFCFGYEEALGYSWGRTVRDKDGISAALAFAELAAEARATGNSVLDRLHALYRQHGLWVSVQHNVVLQGEAGAQRIAEAMNQLGAAPPHEVAGTRVSHVHDFRVRDPGAPSWRQSATLVELALEGGARVLVRPSGTEPKLKIYVDWLAPLEAGDSLSGAEAHAMASALGAARALVAAIGLEARPDEP